jgi:hypothetical protein
MLDSNAQASTGVDEWVHCVSGILYHVAYSLVSRPLTAVAERSKDRVPTESGIRCIAIYSIREWISRMTHPEAIHSADLPEPFRVAKV